MRIDDRTSQLSTTQMSAAVFFIGMGIVFTGAIFGNDLPVGWREFL